MPQIEYLLLADYIRQDGGMTHIMAAGIDTLTIPEDRLPARIAIAALGRVSFDSTDQVGVEHEVSLIWRGPGGAELLRLTVRQATPPPPAGVPRHWRTGAWLIVRLALPLPSYADDYRLEVIMDDDPRMSRSVDVRVVPPNGQA